MKCGFADAGCSLVVRLANLAEHQKECAWRAAQCRHCEGNVRWRDLEEHARKIVCRCGEKVRTCRIGRHIHYDCGNCGMAVRKELERKHLKDECVYRLVDCPHCLKSVRYLDLSVHNEDILCSCRELLKNCFYEKHSHFACEKCDICVPLNAKKIHVDEICVFRLVECKFCKTYISFQDMAAHAENSVCTLCGECAPSCIFRSKHELPCPNACDPLLRFCVDKISDHLLICPNEPVFCIHAHFGCSFSYPRSLAGQREEHEANVGLHLLSAMNHMVHLLEQEKTERKKESQVLMQKINSLNLRLNYPSLVVTYLVKFASNQKLPNCAFSDAVLCSNSRVYFVPSKLTEFLFSFDTETCSIRAEPIAADAKLKCEVYSGAVFNPLENRVYFMPNSKNQELFWHYLEVPKNLVCSYSSPSTPLESFHYNGGCFVPILNRIYLAPYYQLKKYYSWHYYCCKSHAFVMYESEVIENCKVVLYKGAIYSQKQNKVFFCPSGLYGESSWHYVDCASGEVVAYPHHSETSIISAAAYSGGVYDPVNDRIFLVPNQQASHPFWHFIDCATCRVLSYSSNSSFPAVPGAFGSGGFSTITNRIYLAPCKETSYARWYYIDCTNLEVVAYFTNIVSHISDEAYDGVICLPGIKRVYFVPSRQSSSEEWHFIQETN